MTFPNMTLLAQARRNLSLFVIDKAEHLKRVHGFGYQDGANAPSDYPSLLAAWSNSVKTLLPFPVWSGCSDNTIYTSTGANFAFRFWHDSIHATQHIAFNTVGEIGIGIQQVREVQKAFGINSLEGLLMFCDTVKQSQYAEKHNGEFPADQLQFVIDESTAFIERNALKLAA